MPLKPTDVELEMTNSSILVKWAPPEADDLVRVRGYTIGWGVGSPNIFMLALEGSDQRQFDITGLCELLLLLISL